MTARPEVSLYSFVLW